MLSVLLWAAMARAGDVTFCVDYDVDFVDSDVTGSDEDYMRTNGRKPARGIRVEATGSSPVFATFAYAETGSTDPGCATLSLPLGQLYQVKVRSEVEATSTHGATVRYGGSGSNQGSTYAYPAGFFTGATATHDVVLPVGDHWDALAVAGRALTRNQGGRASLDLDIYVPDAAGAIDPPSGCSSSNSCVDGTDVWIHDDHIDRKFRIAYLLGWALLHDMGYDRPSLSKSADDSHCHVSDRSLTLGNLEHTTTGFPEGYAYWYSAATFNKSNEADCSFVFWEDSNWDQLEVCHEEMEVAPGHVLSCATGPSLPPYEPIVPDTDFRSYCLDERSPGLAAASKPGNSVVPLDVVRFLRERVQDDSGLSRNDMGTILASGVGSVGSPTIYRGSLYGQCGVQGGNGSDWLDAAEEHGLDQ